MKKKIWGLSIIIAILFCFMPNVVVTANAPSGIKNNGLGGISIDVNSAPYRTFANTSTWGKNAYTSTGCAWYASARVNELTGKGNVIRSAWNWWNNGESFGFKKSSTPVAGSIICVADGYDPINSGQHVAILEKIEGTTAYISEGGYNSAGSDHGYCIIRTVDISQIASQYASSAYGGYTVFLGYMSFDGNITPPSAPTNCLSESWDSMVQIQWDTVSGATGYECGLIDVNTNNVILKTNTTDWYHKFYDVPKGSYFAYVAAYNSAGYSSHSNWYRVDVASGTKREGLELGDRSDDVKKLQETLNGMTGTSLNTDGYFGTNTEAAVKSYQKEKGLTADGWYGASTKAALENEVKTMQNMLNAVTGTSLGADGWFGPNTQKAVKAYQQKKGLTVDGWYGGITKAALEADYNALTSPATSTSVTSPDPTAAPISTPSEEIEPEISEQPSVGESTPDTTSNNDGSSSVLTVYGGDTLQIAVDDKMADFGDAQPFIDTNSRTQVPIRAVSELLNCTVDWDPVTRSATITRANGDTIVIAIGSVEMTVNGSKVTMDTAALIANDRTYIPLRCVAEAFGLKVNWI